MNSRRALVRPPGPRLAEGLVTHIARSPIDMALAAEQWRCYVAALERCGWTAIEVTPVDECPDAVFVEDTVVVHRDVAVIARPGADERKPETAEVERVLGSLGYTMHRITAPGTLDGGDVLKVEDTIYVGLGGRTNAAGIEQLVQHLAPLGTRVVSVPMTRALHLKSAVTALPDGTVIGYAPLVEDPSRFDRFLAVPEESGAHVVLLGEGRLLMAAGAPKTATLFVELGYEPVLVDISEYEKLEGCVTCLSVRLRGLDR